MSADDPTDDGERPAADDERVGPDDEDTGPADDRPAAEDEREDPDEEGTGPEAKRAATDDGEAEPEVARPALDGGTQTWPELAIGLYDRLTGRGAEIIYEFEDMRVDVPSHVGEDAAHARWYLDGTLRIRTREEARQRR